MIVGEAPGHREDSEGKPFVGNAGHLLDEILPVDRKDVYITNAIHCRPPDNRTPRRSEIAACKRWLEAEIRAVKPKYILILGNVPLMALLGRKGINKARGTPIEQNGIVYFPTYHPSYYLHRREEKIKTTLQSDIEMFFKIVDQGGIGTEKGLNYKIVTDQNLWQAFKDIKQSFVLEIDTETTGLNQFDPAFRIVSLGIGTDTTQWCFPFTHPEHPWSENILRGEKIVLALDKILKNKTLVMQNGKFDTLGMAICYGVWWYCDFDTMLAHYNLDENMRHDLKFIAQYYFKAVDYDIPEEEKHGEGPLDRHCKYLGLDLYYTRRARILFTKMLAEDPATKKLFEWFTMPVSRMYADIEYRGVFVDKRQAHETREFYSRQAGDALEELNKLCPDNRRWKDKKTKEWRTGVNWGSPKQVGEVLFKRLKLKSLEKTGKGADSTNESVLLRLAKKHKIPSLILLYREALKNVGFVDSWLKLSINNRIHPSFKVHGTVTGRPSCEEPNLQQTPRNPKLRMCMSAPPGYVMIDADQSQAEMRIAAELADERAMKFIFKTGGDIHKKTLNEVIGIINPNPTKEERKKAKAVGFGYLFGMWWKKFIIYARDNYGLDISPREAQESRVKFFRTYPALEPWQRRQRGFANRHGYVRNLVGRLRRLPAAMRRDDSFDCKEAERQAINSPVQSLASDITLMGALAIHGDRRHTPDDPRHVPPGIPEFHLVGTIHDSNLGETLRKYAESVTKKIRTLMENPPLLKKFGVELSVPLVADTVVGPWGIEK